MRQILILFLVSSLILMNSPFVIASAFFVPDHNAKAQAQASAFVAQADNPSAVYYNPAGMSQLDGTQIALGTEFLRLETEYENTLSAKEDLQAEWAVVPNAYITSDLGTEKWTVGLGVYPLFGLSTSWDDTGLLRYTATDNSFTMVNVNPAIAYQLFPELSVALGADYYSAYSVIAGGKFNYVVGDADIELEEDSSGWGFNAGGLWKPHPKHSFGLTYRSRVDLELEGEYKIRDIPAGLGFPSSVTYNASSDITLPSITSCGYAFRMIEKLKLEFDVYFVEWSTVDKVVVKDDDTGNILTNTDKDWENTWVFALGGEYLLKPEFALRAGYGYAQNAVPEKTFDPSLPDSNLHMITVGMGYTINKLTIDLAYELGLYEEREIDNNVGALLGTTVDGTYDSLIHNIGVSVTYKF